MKILALLLVALLPSLGKASVYDNLAIYPSTAVHGFTGVVFVAASTATYKVPVITLDGISGNVTAPRFYGDGSNLTGISGGGSVDLSLVRYSTDPVSTALVDLSTVSAAFNNVGVSTASLFTALQSTYTYLNGKTVSLSGIRYSTDSVSTALVDFSTITTALAGKASLADANTFVSSVTVSSNVYIVGFSSATKYYGDGSNLTNLPSAGVSASGSPVFNVNNFYAQTNGVQTQFTLSLEPVLNSLMLTKNGVAMVAPADYSLSGQVITMVTAPVSSTTLVARYAVGVSTDLASVVSDGGPIGEIIQYSSTASPAGFLYADGSYVSTTTYSALFAVTGHRYSTFTVTGSPAVFQLPDFRGMFARGAYGNLNSRDPEVRVVGSTQTDTFQGHWHVQTSRWPTSTAFSGGFPVPGDGNTGGSDNLSGMYAKDVYSDGVNGTPRISPETRPKNIAVAFHIRYANIGTPTITLSTTSAILASNNNWTGTNTFSGDTVLNISSNSAIVNSTNAWTGTNTFTGSVTASSFTTSGNVTAYAVNASSVVSTPQLCLNGTCMTEITASVGAVLASTQTFTGGNTFTHGVTFNDTTTQTTAFAVYRSTALDVISNGLHTLPHGFGTEPGMVVLWAVNTGGADCGYSLGDRVQIQNGIATSAVDNKNYTVYSDTTNIYIKYGSYPGVVLGALGKSTGAGCDLNNTKWKAYVVGYK